MVGKTTSDEGIRDTFPLKQDMSAPPSSQPGCRGHFAQHARIFYLWLIVFTLGLH